MPGSGRLLALRALFVVLPHRRFFFAHWLFGAARFLPVRGLPILIGVGYQCMVRCPVDATLCVQNGSADPIRVFVCNPKSCVPIITATVNMPISELLLDQ